MIKHYYTLKDLVENQLTDWPWQFDVGKPYKYGTKNILEYLHSTFYPEHTVDITEPIGKDLANKLFCLEIAPQYKNVYIGYAFDDSEDSMQDVFNDWWIKFLFLLNTSYDKYAKLIELNETIKDHLLDAISSTSESKFNDTPQNVQGVYDWSDDDHLSTITRNTVTNDTDTKIDRLDNINNKLKDFYDE